LKYWTNVKEVQEMPGHANIEIIIDPCFRVLPGTQQAVARKFDDIIVGKAK
jgi:hypothetical protein